MKSSGFRIGLLTSFFGKGQKIKHSSLQDCLDEDFMAMNLVNHLHLWASTPHEDSWRCLSWKVRTGLIAAIGSSKMFKVSFLSHWVVIESLKEWFKMFQVRFLGSTLWFQHGLWTANPGTPGTPGLTTPLLHQVARWVSPADFPGTWDGSEPQRTEIGHHFRTILLFYLFWGLLHPNKN